MTYRLDINRYWGWLFAWGIILIILGIMAISAAAFTTFLSIFLLSTLLIIGGLIVLIDTFKHWWGHWGAFLFHLLLAILYLAAGIFLYKHPWSAIVSITLILGIIYTTLGIFRIIGSFSLQLPRWGWILLNGFISLILGLLIIGNWPASSLYIIGLFIGIDLFFWGWTYLMIAIAMKNLS